MAAPERLDRRRRRAGRQLVPAAAAPAAVVHRQYRLPPCASPEPAGAELPPAGLPRGGAVTPGPARAQPRRGPARLRAGTVGRGGRPHGALPAPEQAVALDRRSEEHTSELQSLMRISYAVFCLK